MLTAFIPAKSKSKRIPNKNLVELGGKPLYQWTFDICKSWNLIDRVVVATDIPEIEAACAKNDFDVYPLSGGDIQDKRTVRQLWQSFAANNEGDHLLLQLTCPFRLVKDLESAWQLYKNNDADVVVSVKQEHDVMVDKNGRSSTNNMARLSQNEEPHYYITAAFWFAKTTHLATAINLQEGKVFLASVHPISWLDINTPEDLELARVIAVGLNHTI